MEKRKQRKAEELNLIEWNELLDEYKKTPFYRPYAAMRIENTMFTSARRAGGMRFNSDTYTYFEPEIPGEKPNADGSPYVAWLMVRDDFLRWVKKQLRKGGAK